MWHTASTPNFHAPGLGPRHEPFHLCASNLLNLPALPQWLGLTFLKRSINGGFHGSLKENFH